MSGIRVMFSPEDAQATITQNTLTREPYYTQQHNEIAVFERAYKNRQAVALLGPTGCGKSRFVEHMAFKLQRPILTIPGYESVDAGTVIGSVMATGGESIFIPGKLYKGAKINAFVHMEEILEMNPDVLPLAHEVSDWRRRLEVDDTGETIQTEEGFMFVVSMNPGAAYQKPQKRFPKPSFIQRFVAIRMGYVRGQTGQNILVKEGKILHDMAVHLDTLARKIDTVHDSREYAGTLHESIGYHALINTALQISAGTPPHDAVHDCISSVLSHDIKVINAIDDLAKTIIPLR